MKYHIVITDNETGEVIHDGNAVAILASIQEDAGTRSLTFTSCNAIAFGSALCGLLSICKEIKKTDPMIFKLARKTFKKHKGE